MKTLMFTSRWVAGLLAGATLAVGAAAQAAPSGAAKTDLPLSRTLAAGSHFGRSSVIITTQGRMTVQNQAALAALGADISRHLPLIHAVAARVPTRNLGKLAALPFVSHLSSDGQIKKCDEFTVASSGASTAFQQYGLIGSGITVAVVDSGIGDSPDIKDKIIGAGSRLLAAVNFVPEGPNNQIPATGQGDATDKCGHGTHVAGIIAGNGKSSHDDPNSHDKKYFRTFYGIAPNANLVNVRVLDGTGQSTVSTVISGLQWVVANKSKYNIRVINLSLGHPVGESYKTDPLCQAVEAAWKAGIVVVCAAGNEGRLNVGSTAGLDNEGWGTSYGSINSPGNDPYVITVGATKSMDGNRAHDRIATYSSRGPSRLDLILKPDIIAPGNRIISTLAHDSYLDKMYSKTNQVPQSYYMTKADPNHVSDKYFYLSGTSMAAPVVSSAAVLLLQANPKLTPDTIKARLMASADKWADPNGSGDACTYGAGYLNIPAVLISTLNVNGEYAVSPSLSIDSQGNVYVNDDHALWGKTTVSSNHAIWGKDLLWGVVGDLHAIWGKNALASSETVAGNTSLAGSNIVTDNHALWGKSVWSDRAVWGSTSSAVDLTSTAINGE